MFVNYLYFYQLFSSYKQLVGETPHARSHEARPDTLVEVSARSVHSGTRGRRPKFFSGGSGLDDFPGFDTRGLFLYVRTSEMSSFFWSFMYS